MCFLLLVFSLPIVFSSTVVFNSSFASGETLTLGGITYELRINPSNNDLFIFNPPNEAISLSYFSDTLIGNYVWSHQGTEKVGSQILNQTGFGDTPHLQTRVKLLISTYEPLLDYEWIVSSDSVLVGEELEFTFIVNNSQEALAENVTFAHELPDYFILEKVRNCQNEGTLISFSLDLDEGDEFECIFSGYVLQSRDDEDNLSAKLSFQTSLQNVTLYPSIEMSAVSDPFTIEFDTDFDLNRTQEFDLNVTLINDISDRIRFSDLELYVPRAYFTKTTSSFLENAEFTLLPFTSSLDHIRFTKNSLSIEGVGDEEDFRFRFIADELGYIPIVLLFNYEFDKQDYVYGPKRIYYNITISDLDLSYEPAMNYSLYLTNISDSSLETFTTKSENLHFKIGNECVCVLENISLDVRFFNESLFSQKWLSLEPGEVQFVSSLDHYMPFSITDKTYAVTGLLSYYFEGERF